MSLKSLLFITCVLALSSLIKADIEITLADSVPGFNSDPSIRLLKQKQPKTICKFFLLNSEMMNNPNNANFKTVALNVNGPPYEGSVNSLDFVSKGLSFNHNLVRIVYDGIKCDCTVTVYQGHNNQGRSKNYEASGDIGRIILDKCWANKAESLSITCKA